MKAPLAIVTMVYNEAEFLPVWLRHYGAAVGEAHCYVVDHGSTDGSTAPERTGEASVIRIPRSPQDDSTRNGFIGDLCAGLLRWYRSVIYVDVDEILVVDPDVAQSLRAFADGLPEDAVVTAIGLDVIHAPDEEPSIDWSLPIGRQRRWLRFSSAMCKPVIIRRRVAWAPGFHCIDAAPWFAPLFLFHLRYADLPSGLRRLQRTRTQPWITPQAGAHQRMPDGEWETMLRRMAGLPRVETVPLKADDSVVGPWLGRVIDSTAGREREKYRIDLHINGDQLWEVPERLRDLF
ncbi:glycosyltransferase family 2 protein [Acetobacteraceae bacterium KSS8]|uniref:Glycosyltransferase family 2 protein n=1 Tax=Endosaccharibacter trunci TaxID=2812733 RepID=A0ABT1W4Y8_9PROT|nr:glycosyltransferase family 2 protein [Acetobacteraceae bacterium KSS8]